MVGKTAKRGQPFCCAKSQSPFAIALILFVIALLPRLLCLYQFQNSFFADLLELDQKDYDMWAQRIAGGLWFESKVQPGMPFSAYFLSIIYSIFGHATLWARFFQILMGAGSAVLVFFISQQLTRNTLLAGSIFTASLLVKTPYYYEMTLVAATLTGFLLLCVVFVLFKAVDRPAFWKFILGGFVLGLAITARANAAALLLVMVPWVFFARRTAALSKRALYTFLFLGSALLPLAPITISNYIIAQDFMPLTYHSGLEFYLGNGPYADGRHSRVPPFLAEDRMQKIEGSYLYAEQEAERSLKPSEVSNFWFKKGIEHIRENPRKFLGLMLRKVRLIFTGFEMPDHLSLQVIASAVPFFLWVPLDFFILAPLAAGGVVLTLQKDKKWILLHLVFIAYLFTLSFSLVSDRYKAPMFYPLILFAVLSVFQWGSPVIAVRRKIMAAVITGFLLVVSLDAGFIKEYGPDPWAGFTMVGLERLRRQEPAEAVKMFEKALQFADQNVNLSHNNLGVAYERSGDQSRAAHHYQKAVSLNE